MRYKNYKFLLPFFDRKSPLIPSFCKAQNTLQGKHFLPPHRRQAKTNKKALLLDICKGFMFL